MATATYLSEIMTAHRAAAAADDRDFDVLRKEALAAPTPGPFTTVLAVRAETGLGLIAEVKRRSPSKGGLAPDLDPAEVAAGYQAGGATCLSVLTDRDYFGGSPADLRAAAAATSLPILRKDFTVAAADLYDARIMGADAVLLIVAALNDTELVEFLGLAAELSLDALVEVHDEAELDRALQAGSTLVGVNQRDLTTFAVDPGRAVRVGRAIPPAITSVAESGIRDADDARRLADAGFQAVLVGETLVTASDRAAAVWALVGHPVGRRAGTAGSRTA